MEPASVSPTVSKLLVGQDNFEQIYVHGSIKGNGIVFGVQDSADIWRTHISFLRKGAQGGFFKRYLVSELMEQASYIEIFGHSLGNTDHTQFEDFCSKLERDENRPLSIHYHGESGFNEIMQQLDGLTKKRLSKFMVLRQCGMTDCKQ